MTAWESQENEAISRFALTRSLWVIVALLSLVAAGIGVANPSIYGGVIAERTVPGVFTQDLLSVVLSVGLVLIAFSSDESLFRRRIVAHGVLGFYFYAYGIYAIEQVYNWLYPIYLAIFGMSLFVLVYSVATVPKDIAAALTIRPSVRLLGAGYGILIAVLFNVIWFSQLLPLLRSGSRIEFLFSIYIIDLSFVMPAFVIAAILTIRRHPVGLMGLPALFVLGVGILSPLALAEAIKPIRYGVPSDTGEFWLLFVLSAVFVVFAGVFLATLKSTRSDRSGKGEAEAGVT